VTLQLPKNAGRIRKTISFLFVDKDIELMNRAIEEYSIAALNREGDTPLLVPLRTMSIPGYIRKASAQEKNAGAWVLRLGNPVSSD
jgi:hypothetical protein